MHPPVTRGSPVHRHLTFALVFAIGFAVSWLVKDRVAARPEPPAAEPVNEISVMRPDPTAPGGHAATRIRVTKSGMHKIGPGEQAADEWGVVLWYGVPDDQPRRYVSY